MTEKKYVIGGKIYLQRPLVLGQYQQLLNILGDIAIPANADIPAMIAVMGALAPAALAVVLTPAPLWRRVIRWLPSPRRKNIKALAAKIEFVITPEQIVEVVEDFFDCNPLPLLLERLTKVAGENMEKIKEKTKSEPSASSSPAGT